MRRFGRTVLGGMVALGLLAAVPAAVFAAQPSCGDTLTSNTTLTADLDCSGYSGTALTLGAKGITLDLGGHTLWGPTGGQDNLTGVDTGGYNKVTVKHGTIANFTYAVYEDGSLDSTFKKLTITGDPADSDDYGFDMSYGVGNTITSNHISGVYYGLYLYGGADTTVSSNHITDAGYAMYAEYESDDHFTGNYAEYSYAGFYDDYGSHQTYKGNTANGGPGSGSYGFYLDCDDYGWVHFTNNVSKGNSSYGVYTYYCYDDTSPMDGSVITGNVSHNNGSYGFYDYYSHGTTWTYNTAKHNASDGFYLDYPGKVVFQHNVASANDGSGIDVTDNYGTGYGNFKSLSYNKANNNGDYGMYASYGVPNTTGNVATGNSSQDCFNIRCN